jgi:hypothetical protein
MNIYGKLLVACVLQTNVWGTAAFVTQKSKGFAFRGTDGLSPTVSYLDSNGKGSYMASSKLASSEGSTQGEGVMDNSQSRGPSSSSPAVCPLTNMVQYNVLVMYSQMSSLPTLKTERIGRTSYCPRTTAKPWGTRRWTSPKPTEEALG